MIAGVWWSRVGELMRVDALAEVIVCVTKVSRPRGKLGILLNEVGSSACNILLMGKIERG